jgi:predicted lactoylglutathione lyase
MTVAARVSLITLGVADVAKSTAFYQALGWPLSPSSVPGEVSFFNTDGGFLALWGRDDLARDAGATGEQAGFRGVALAINLESRELVDACFDEVRAIGGEVVKPPGATDWGGYSGYFADPDGHLWEVAHNPSWPMGADGRPGLPRA